MRDETKAVWLGLALLACIALAVAITSGALGGMSDLDAFKRASQPLNR
jgi:hypothetical protein